MSVEIPKEIEGNEEMMAAWLASNQPEGTPAQQPAAELTPAQPAQPEPAPQEPSAQKTEPFDETKFLSGLGFKTKDEILAIKSEYEKIKSQPATSKIDDPVLYGLNRIKAERPDDFEFFMKMKLGQGLDPIDLLTADYIRRNPSKKENVDLVRDFVKRKYNLDIKIPPALDEDDASPDEIRERNEQIREAKRNLEFAQMQMDEDVEKIKASYDSEFEEFAKGASSAPTPEKIAEMAKPWQPVANTFMANVKAVPIFMPGPDGNPVKFMEFAIPAEQVEAYTRSIVDFAVSSGLPMEESSVQKIYEHILGQVYMANMPKINHAIAEKARTMSEQEYDLAYRNPSALKEQVQPGGAYKSKYEESREKALAAEGFI
jgi:hypothetical protein